MKRAVIMVFAACLLGGLSIVQCSKPRTATDENKAGKTEGDTTVYNEKGRKLVAYYLHGTFRCPTCLSIEKQSKETVETEFADLVKEGTVVFLPLNYDEPENKHFQDDYKLTAPSLVLSVHDNGKEVTWKNLPEVWDHAHNPPALREYVAGELGQMLMEMH